MKFELSFDYLMGKKFKAIKHVILLWGDREHLRFPYPIFLFDLQAVSFDGSGVKLLLRQKTSFFGFILTRSLWF